MLEEFKNKKKLVPLTEILGVAIDARLPEKYHWSLPWTRDLLFHLGEKFFKRFGKNIKINSAIRTVGYQTELSFINPNTASPTLAQDNRRT
jgi:hypothetical protein